MSHVFCASAGPLKSGTKPQPQVYSSLLSSGCQAGEHAACFAELRRNFINTCPPKLKSLMLLVKHWYRQVSTLPPPPPPSQEATPITVFTPKCLGWSTITTCFQVVLQREQLLGTFFLCKPFSEGQVTFMSLTKAKTSSLLKGVRVSLTWTGIQATRCRSPNSMFRGDSFITFYSNRIKKKKKKAQTRSGGVHL